MEFNEIVSEIRSNLTGDREKDNAFLSTQIQKYVNHEYGEEIIREISRMIWDGLSDEEKEKFIKISQEETPVIDFINEVMPLLSRGEISEALDMMDRFVEGYPFRFKDTKVDEYHIFTNPIEHILFMETYQGDKEIRLIPDDENYLVLFSLYSKVLWDAGRHEDSKNAALRALKYDPVDAELLHTLMLYYDGIRDDENVKKYAKEILKYGYNPEFIANAYRFLGYWYYNYQDFETSAALYILSLVFEDHITAKTELALINDFIPVRDVDVISKLEEMDIQVGANPKIFEILEFLISQAMEKGDDGFKEFCENIYQNLVKPDEINDKISELENSFDEILELFKEGNNPFEEHMANYIAHFEYDVEEDELKIKPIRDQSTGENIDIYVDEAVQLRDDVSVYLDINGMPIEVNIKNASDILTLDKYILSIFDIFDLVIVTNDMSVLFKGIVGKHIDDDNFMGSEFELNFNNPGIVQCGVSFSHQDE